MYYSDKIKNKAFQLFCNGETLSKISKQLGVSRETLRKWREKGRWKEYKREIDDKSLQQLGNNLADWKSQTIEQLIEIRDNLVKRYKQAKTGNVEQLTKAILGLNEQIALLKGEVTQRGEEEIRIIFEDV